MAYQTVPSVSPGDLWSADDFNVYIRDNFAAGVPDIFTTAGDIVYGTSADVGTRLGIGSAYQTLHSTTSAPAYSGAVGCSVYRSTTYNFTANNTWYNIPFDAEEWDSSAFHNTGSDREKLTVPSGMGGVYHIWWVLTFRGWTDDGWVDLQPYVWLRLRQNTVNRVYQRAVIVSEPLSVLYPTDPEDPPYPIEVNNFFTFSGEITLALSAGQYVSMQMRTDHKFGTGLGDVGLVNSSDVIPRFGMEMIR